MGTKFKQSVMWLGTLMLGVLSSPPAMRAEDAGEARVALAKIDANFAGGIWPSKQILDKSIPATNAPDVIKAQVERALPHFLRTQYLPNGLDDDGKARVDWAEWRIAPKLRHGHNVLLGRWNQNGAEGVTRVEAQLYDRGPALTVIGKSILTKKPEEVSDEDLRKLMLIYINWPDEMAHSIIIQRKTYSLLGGDLVIIAGTIDFDQKSADEVKPPWEPKVKFWVSQDRLCVIFPGVDTPTDADVWARLVP